MSAAFCDTHFRGMEQRAHSIVLPSVVLKGRYYMTQGQDLLTGSVPKKLIRFAFPLFLANLLQALYNVVDMLVVGKIVGKTGLAAISNASMLCFIINSLCIGLTMGGSVLVAQCKGANDQTGQRDTIGMLFFLSLVGSAVVTILGLAIYEALFQALNVPANAYQDACGYMKIICCGTVFVFGYNAVCSILRGLGDSQTPLFFVGVATVLNVVLDVLLVGPLSMGTAGAAWATITAQGVSFMGSLVYLRRYQLGFSLTKIEFHREKLLAILKVGLPTAIQMVVVNTAYLLVTGMLNQFGTPVAAASGVGLKINTFAGMHCWAIGQAITAMVGQCLGAGQIERARKVVRSGLLLNLVVTAAVVVVVQLLAEPLICMFDGTSPEVIRCGVQYLRACCSINSLIYAAMYTLDSFAIGVGAAHVAMVNALLDAVVVRLPVGWLLAFPLSLGFSGIYLGQALSPILPGRAAFHGHGRRSLGHYHGSGCFLYGVPGISTAVSAGLFSYKNRVSSGKAAGHLEGWPAHRHTDGCGEHGLSAGDRDAQPVWNSGGRCVRCGTEDQHLCRDALLGHRSGNNRHGGPVLGGWPN